MRIAALRNTVVDLALRPEKTLVEFFEHRPRRDGLFWLVDRLLNALGMRHDLDVFRGGSGQCGRKSYKGAGREDGGLEVHGGERLNVGREVRLNGLFGERCNDYSISAKQKLLSEQRKCVQPSGTV